MKTLVIGSGGREHALAWKLAQSETVYATPGNPGIAKVAECIAAAGASPQNYLDVAEAIDADLTVVGPELPLVAGVVDCFQSAGRFIVGPAKDAARLEGSKVFAKHVMAQAGIPTARYRATTSETEALQALQEFSYPVVLKADGLAAGKGVIIAQDFADAQNALRSIYATLGSSVVIEEFLQGEEASFIALCAGTTAIPLEASQDHKTIFDDDRGPNTGGMGAYCDGRILNSQAIVKVMVSVIYPTLDYMKSIGTPFHGFLYAGLMMTADGPKVLEFNVRLGDPETQCLLHRISGGFPAALMAAAHGSMEGVSLTWNPDPSVCIVLASEGYPDSPKAGDFITGIDDAESSPACVFHAGTKLGTEGLRTAGGRVLGVTASGTTLQAAIDNAYNAADRVQFRGMQMRHDIGRKGLKRW